MWVDRAELVRITSIGTAIIATVSQFDVIGVCLSELAIVIISANSS